MTKFFVYPEYVIEGDKILAKNSYRGETARFYIPNHHRPLWPHVSKITDEEELLKFAHRFGLLGVVNGPSGTDLHNPMVKTVKWDSVEETIKISSAFRELASLWKAANEGTTIPPDVIEDAKVLLWGKYWLQEERNQVKNWSPEALAKSYVIANINAHLKGVRVQAQVAPDGKVKAGVDPVRLLDVAWYHFYLDITDGKPFKQCPQCGTLHTGKGKYCPAPPNYSRSPCENKRDRRKYRK